MEDKEIRGPAAVVPSLNPDRRLKSTMEGLLETGFADVILVNDGSTPETLPYFQELNRLPQVTLLTHSVNRGKGAAMKTAFSWLLEHRPDCPGVVTVDGDGQHHPEDALACARRMLEREEVVLGCRDFSRPEVPPRSRMGNRITRGVFKVFCGMTISDTQTGLRAIPRRYLEELTAVAGDRYEYETNMLLAMKDRHIPWGETPIRTIYLEENRSSHFHARILSSLLNFSLNRWVVFQSRGPLGRSLARYYALALPLLLAQFLLTEGVFRAAHIADRQTILRTVIYAVVMTVLFVGSYVIQHRWVFGDQEERKRHK